MNPLGLPATPTSRRIGVVMLVLVAATALSLARRRPRLGPRITRTAKVSPRVTPTPLPAPPSGVPLYRPTLQFFRGRFHPNEGVVRDVHVSVVAMWRRTGQTWAPQESAHEALVVSPNRERAVADLVGPDVTDGLFAA